jgi:hypothetical protein
VAAVVFFVVVAGVGLLGATWAGTGRFEFPTRGARSAHLSKANDYRVKAAAAQREAEVHRGLIEGTGTPGNEVLSEAFISHCRQVAAAADELSRVERQLSDYHEEQARLLDAVATQER